MSTQDILFVERLDRMYRYETYFSRLMSTKKREEIFEWCTITFGTLGDKWDNHGGWLYLRSDQELTMFMLRWTS